jgi:hypothetical protein
MSGSSKAGRYAIVDAELHDITGQGQAQFDVWVVPAGELAAFRWQRQYPGGALALVAEDHPAARSAWDAGKIYEDEFPFWRVPGSGWTESLYREAARRWALAVSGQPDMQLRYMRSSPLDMTREQWAEKAQRLFED